MLTLYNTASRKKELFTPLNPPRVTIYTCGPTVYNEPTLGNLRTYVFEDVLKRVLLYFNFKPNHVMNITDVGHLTSDADSGEDKIQKAAEKERKTAWDIAKHHEATFRTALKELHVIPPNTWCRATSHIKEQIQIIEVLEKKGFTYKTSDGVYFDTSKFPPYENFAKLDVEHLREGARMEKNSEKRSGTDFALWKFSPKNTKRDMEWRSPWGIGFPGWHIECSSMSMKYLSPKTFDINGFHPEKFETIDIHCGGTDHINVHHTNEIAQSEAATGSLFAKYWLHGAFLTIHETRMGKSKGNAFTIQSLIDHGFYPVVYRYLLLQTHYRSLLNFSWEAMESAKKGVFHLYKSYFEFESHQTDIRAKSIESYQKQFNELIGDDLNTPQALSLCWNVVHSQDLLASEKKKLLQIFDAVFGLDIPAYARSIKRLPVSQEIKQKIKERKLARENKNFAASDALRKEIEEKGYEILDKDNNNSIIRPTASSWRPM